MTTAYPDSHCPCFARLVPLVYRTKSGSGIGWSLKSGLLAYFLAIMWGPTFSHKKQSGQIQGLTRLSSNMGVSHNIPWYWVIQDVDSHSWGSPRWRVLTSCRAFTNKSWPKVSLVASRISKATAATAHQHPSHPGATLSSWLEISHWSAPCPHSLGQHSHSHLVLFSHIKGKWLSKVWQAQGGCWCNCTGFEFYYQWDLFSQPGGGCGLSSAQTSGNWVNSLSWLFSPSGFLARRLCNLHASWGVTKRKSK